MIAVNWPREVPQCKLCGHYHEWLTCAVCLCKGSPKLMSSDNDTPIPAGRKRNHEQRLMELESGQGKLAGDYGRLWELFREYRRKVTDLTHQVEELKDGPQRDSETHLSVSPQKFRLRLKNLSGWVIIGIMMLVTLVALAFLLLRKI